MSIRCGWTAGLKRACCQDNIFFKTSYSPVLGPGYIGDDGELKAGVDMWHLRDFMRRSAVMQAAMGRRHTILWPHMTTFNVLPIIGWASINCGRHPLFFLS